MFTGIIETLGTVKSVAPSGEGLRMTIEASFGPKDMQIGDSVAVNGACLTIVSFDNRAFNADVSPETLSKTTLGRIKMRDTVNLERAVRLGDRLGGHLVTGHIDGTGKVLSKRREGNAVIFMFAVAPELSRYIIPKGSVALDGISLTVNTCSRKSFEVSIIPHTLTVTTLRDRRVGDEVNVETDMIGKYVERFTRPFTGDGKPAHHKGKRVDESLLRKTGYL